MSEASQVNPPAALEEPEDEDVYAELIQIVKLHSVLHNPASASNRNKFLKEKHWNEVGTVMNRDGIKLNYAYVIIKIIQHCAMLL